MNRALGTGSDAAFLFTRSRNFRHLLGMVVQSTLRVSESSSSDSALPRKRDVIPRLPIYPRPTLASKATSAQKKRWEKESGFKKGAPVVYRIKKDWTRPHRPHLPPDQERSARKAFRASENKDTGGARHTVRQVMQQCLFSGDPLPRWNFTKLRRETLVEATRMCLQAWVRWAFA